MDNTKNIMAMLTMTAQVMQQDMTPESIRIIADDLSGYGADMIGKALKRVRLECQRLTPAAILERLDDGRVSAEEAWSRIPQSEYESVCWTQEAQTAWAVAAPLLEAGDKVVARFAFAEKYRDEVRKARGECLPPKWTVSLGLDQQQRETCLKQAVESNKLGREYALGLLGSSSYKPTKCGLMLLATAGEVAALPKPKDDGSREKAIEQIDAIMRETFGRGVAKLPTPRRKLAVGDLSPDGRMQYRGGDAGDAASWVFVGSGEGIKAKHERVDGWVGNVLSSVI